MVKKKSKPYEKRTDIEKIKSQWKKLRVLHNQNEWSAVVVRAATMAEIAVNMAIRCEFNKRSEFGDTFIDGLLLWANGLSGKLDRLLLPLLKEERNNYENVQKLKSRAKKINDKRNAIVHRGAFCKKIEVQERIEDSKIFVLGIVQLYDPDFELSEL